MQPEYNCFQKGNQMAIDRSLSNLMIGRGFKFLNLARVGQKSTGTWAYYNCQGTVVKWFEHGVADGKPEYWVVETFQGDRQTGNGVPELAKALAEIVG